MSTEINTMEQWNALSIGTEFTESFGSNICAIRATKVSEFEYSGTKHYMDDDNAIPFKKDFRKEFSMSFFELSL